MVQKFRRYYWFKPLTSLQRGKNVMMFSLHVLKMYMNRGFSATDEKFKLHVYKETVWKLYVTCIFKKNKIKI